MTPQTRSPRTTERPAARSRGSASCRTTEGAAGRPLSEKNRFPSHTTGTDALTPNQFVAQRIRELRLQRGLTLQAAAELLAPYLCKHWSDRALSRAEQSAHTGNWIKPFNADEIQAFADAFGVTTTSFFAASSRNSGHRKSAGTAAGRPRGTGPAGGN